ncbi:scarecrow-like protein 3 [Setaria italica]|uniref:scarecrow-like protein 3 n=1 Tax=Setaria italica TaxID=4555 RepID=UPI0006467672|nr:scarecrow-like protein 3 [Setaria italica]
MDIFPEDTVSSATSSPASSLYSPSPHGYGSWVQELSHDQQGVRLIGLLYQCAAEVAAGAFDRANHCLEQITQLASLDAPHTLQRLAAVFADALARKLLNLVPGLSRALLSTANSGEAHLIPGARRHLFDMLPFMKLAYLTTNHAILEAMEGEKYVHVVDLSGPAANPVQWIALFHAFRGRRGGPPHLRVTAVHDGKEFLANMAGVLAREAEAFDIPFQFSSVEARLDDLDPDALRQLLRVRSGEALAVSVVAQLHRLLAADDAASRRHVPGSSCLTPVQIMARSSPSSFGELLERELNTRLQLSPDASSVVSSLSPQSPVVQAAQQRPAKLGRFLQAVRALCPKIMVVAEPEANHNAASFLERFEEALNYYASLFDCLERASAAHHRQHASERAWVERLVLGEEVRGVVAREGAERKERHERLAQWGRRMEAAGMERVGMSYGGMMEARKLLQSLGWGGSYEVVHDARGDAFFFCWHRKPLYSVSAWRPAACRHGAGRLVGS